MDHIHQEGWPAVDERMPPGARFRGAVELTGSRAEAGSGRCPGTSDSGFGPGSRTGGNRSGAGSSPAETSSGAGSRTEEIRFDLDVDNAWPAVRAVLEQACERVPEEWEIEGPAVTISLGDAADVDPALLAAMTGPDGLGGQALGAQFGQRRAADALRPGPILAALTEQAVENVASLSDDELMGALQASRRIENRAAWQQTTVVAELARRRKAQFDDAVARKVPRGCRPGEFPADELVPELLITRAKAEHRIAVDRDLVGRLPATLAGMAAGLISVDRADVIAFYTAALGDADAVRADQVLADAAPGLRTDQLLRKAAALEMKLDPAAAKARKEITKQTRQRVEAGRELSGNAYLAGRELDTGEVMAGKAHIDAIAARLRRAGLDGTLDQLRTRAFADLVQGRNPLDRIAAVPGSHPADPANAAPDHTQDSAPDPGPPSPDPGTDRDRDPGSGADPDLDFDPGPDPGLTPPPASGPPAPLPALINLIVPVGTLLGWSTAPAQAGSWGLFDSEDIRNIVQAASRHPRTRTCITVIGPDGTAIAHGCSAGQHPWTPQSPGSPPQESPPPGTPPRATPPPGTAPPGTAPPRANHDPDPPDSHGGIPPDGTFPPADDTAPPAGGGPDAAQAAQLRDLLRELNVTLEPIARGACDHRHAENHYRPSRKLQHLVRARTAMCSAPGCDAQAVRCDIDHVIPYPDGPTDECNIHPGCRRHHRCKQAPGWQAEQPEPGVLRWTTPAGRVYTTTPTVYDA
jgi:hypothetical protein